MNCKNCKAEWTPPANASISNCPFCGKPLFDNSNVKKEVEPHEILLNIVQQYDKNKLGDTLLKGMLSDLMPHVEKKYQRIFKQALDDKIGLKLLELENEDDSMQNIKLNTLRHSFKNNNGFDSTADYVVDCFLFALGWIETVSKEQYSHDSADNLSDIAQQIDMAFIDGVLNRDESAALFSISQKLGLTDNVIVDLINAKIKSLKLVPYPTTPKSLKNSKEIICASDWRAEKKRTKKSSDPGVNLNTVKKNSRVVSSQNVRKPKQNETQKRNNSKDNFSNDQAIIKNYELPVNLGKTASNESFVADLAKMPHLLIADSMGISKSAIIKAIIDSLLKEKKPDELKFVIVEAKKGYHVFAQIIEQYRAKLPNSAKELIIWPPKSKDITYKRNAVRSINSMLIEMENRIRLLKEAKVHNVKEYNAMFVETKLNSVHGHKYLPYLVFIIDEFAELILTAQKERSIIKIAQNASSVGIHMIIATQQISQTIITGNIKASFPARIAFSVPIKIQSTTILDRGGAEKLSDKKDMIFSQGSNIVNLRLKPSYFN